MSPQQRWKRVQALCEQAELLPAAGREPFLQEAEPDEALRAEVLDLLRALDGEQHARGELQQAFQSTVPPLPELIAGYRVTGLLGRGGTSTVYAAERDTDGVTSSVAIKVLHSHLLDEAATARFQREHRILSRLDHPALCRVLDAGITAERQPFLVLERVDGKPIDEYANEHKLGVAERVRLVIAAAGAVEAAHRNFIAHLDLKPGNLFVSTNGHVRLLDFGTAKLLDPLGTGTTTHHLTPVYASPEQLRGDPLTMASDIYSLGLILYELLAGVSPYSEKSLVSIAERAAGVSSTQPMARRVTEDAAAARGLTVDRLRRLLGGDIETVVAKALAQEPGRRYATVGEFAADLRRYLEGRPVLARRQTASYRLKKYVARNRGRVAVTFVLGIGLLAAAGYGLWQQNQALAAGRRAQTSANFLMWLINSSNPMYGGRADMTVVELVNRAEERLRRGDVLDGKLSTSMEALLGAFLFSAGQQQRGAGLARSAWEQARKSGDGATLLTATATLGGMSLSQGDCVDAVKVFREGDAVLALPTAVPATARISYLISRDQVRANCEQDLSGRLTAQAVALLPAVRDDNVELDMPVRLWKALVYNGSARALIQQKRYAESRQSAELGLRLAQQEPDGRNIRLALLQSRAAAEYAEGNVAAAAASLDGAATLAEGSASAFESIRLKVMAGQRLAEAGQKDRAISLADEAVAQAARRSNEIAQTKWMILIDAATTYYRADHCEKTPPLLAEADALTGGKMPPQWKGNRLAIESICLARAGDTARAKTVGAQALAAAGATWSTSSGLRKRIEDIVAGKIR